MAKGKRYERSAARRLGKRLTGKYHGPDALNGQFEAKAWSKPMSKYDVMAEIAKGRTIIASKSGYTDGAVEYAERYHPRVKLYKGSKRLDRVT